jgi:hypothetical protein
MDTLAPAVAGTTSAAQAAAIVPKPRTGDAPDALVHAAEARATYGLSPVALGLAFIDWATHLANAPFRRLGLAKLALLQSSRLFEAGWGRTAIAPAPGDHRFQSAGWQTQPFNLIRQAFLLGEEWWAAAGSAPQYPPIDGAPGVTFASIEPLAPSGRLLRPRLAMTAARIETDQCLAASCVTFFQQTHSAGRRDECH